MSNYIIQSSRSSKRITAVGVVPLLLASVAADLFCAPRTEKFGSAIYRKMVWEELLAFLDGEKRVTIVLAEGGAVRGELTGIPANGIHLGRVSMTTKEWLYLTDSEALISRSSVREIRVEKRRGLSRVARPILGGASAMLLAWLALSPAKLDADSAREMSVFWTTSIGASVGGAVLGYRMGKSSDVETTNIMIVG